MNKKMREILASIENKKIEAKSFLAKNEKAKAKTLIDEIRDLREEFEIEAELYEDDKKEILNKKDKDKDKIKNKEKLNEVVAFNKAVLNQKLTDAEAALINEKTGADGGFLVPEQQSTEIKELKRGRNELKKYCTIIPVVTKSGSMPLEVGSDEKLLNFEEGSDMTESDIKFAQVKFDVKNYGDLVPVSNILLQDEQANLTKFIGKRFAKKAVRTENEAILDCLNESTEKATGTTYNAISDAIIEMDAAIQEGVIIITNQTSLKYLKNLNDEQGRPLLNKSLTNPKQKEFDIWNVLMLNDTEYKPVAGKKNFIAVNLPEAIAFFEREGFEMSTSSEAGFTKNVTFMKLIERFDVALVDKKAVKHIEITPAQ